MNSNRPASSPSANAAFTCRMSSTTVVTAPMTTMAMSCVTSHLRSTHGDAVHHVRGQRTAARRQEGEHATPVELRIGGEVDAEEDDEQDSADDRDRGREEGEEVARRAAQLLAGCRPCERAMRRACPAVARYAGACVSPDGGRDRPAWCSARSGRRCDGERRALGTAGAAAEDHAEHAALPLC